MASNSWLAHAYSCQASAGVAGVVVVVVTGGVGEMGVSEVEGVGGGGDQACLSECVTFPDQRIFLIKVPYPFYHAYPRSD